MASFDFITAKAFRESLEADHAEMIRCADAQAWKSVQVLAGSIVESLLLDYLASTKHPARSSKDPLKMDLSEAIEICRSETVLSDRNADLCSVIKSYRNLIHPGRMVRLGEKPPNQASSSIAIALVEIIAQELAATRRKVEGLTGEQILSKIQRDANASTILKHLLSEVNASQQERLLLELIPSAHRTSGASPEDFDDKTERLENAYRIILNSVDEHTRQRVASEFVRVLREEDGDQVLRYGAAFFRPSDLKFVSKQHQAMVREHLLGITKGFHSFNSLSRIAGIGGFLEPNDAEKWFNPFVRTIASSTVKDNVKDFAWDFLLSEVVFTKPEVDTIINTRLDKWIRRYDEEQIPEVADRLRTLKKEIAAQIIPF